MRVLITGVTGHIGSVLSEALRDEHEIRGVDERAPEKSSVASMVVGDCADPEVAARAVEGMDAVVHLAGTPSETDLPTILHGQVETTAALLDAMVRSGVRRMVYASSNHAVGMTPRTDLLSTEVRFRPDTFYGVRAALRASVDGVHVVYGVSANAGGLRALDPGRAIGYEPLDDASVVVGELPIREEDDAEGARVGGPHATDAFARRPFPDPLDDVTERG